MRACVLASPELPVLCLLVIGREPDAPHCVSGSSLHQRGASDLHQLSTQLGILGKLSEDVQISGIKALISIIAGSCLCRAKDNIYSCNRSVYINCILLQDTLS